MGLPWRRLLGVLGAALGALVLLPGAVFAAAPYAPAPTPVTALPRFADGLALVWRAGPSTTRLLNGRIAVVGPDVTLVALYRRPGRRGSLLWQLTADGQREIATALLALKRHSYTAGNVLQLTLAIPDARPQQAVFTFRRGRLPTTRVSYPVP